VADWLDGKRVYPLTVEISPSGACNHRCRFCAFDYLGYQPALLEEELMVKNLALMAQKGVKAIVLAGEGEPLLNKATPGIIRHIKELGMDAGMSSNGVLFAEKISEECLPYLTWVRFSINAGTPKTHHLIHQGRPDDFVIILKNLTKAVQLKRDHQWTVTLGVQMLLLPENMGEAVELGKLLKEIGLDYFTVKPYSQHPKSINKAGASMDYQHALELEQQLNHLRGDDFQVYFRSGSMQRLHKERRYSHCMGLPFWAYIDSQGNVWACISYIGDPLFCYGNLHQATFSEIWEGECYARLMQHIQTMDITDCRELCRLDEINVYLDQLKNPHHHCNFI
jgi:radical SAM protein with 4Fe4S-binding SPASM domain